MICDPAEAAPAGRAAVSDSAAHVHAGRVNRVARGKDPLDMERTGYDHGNIARDAAEEHVVDNDPFGRDLLVSPRIHPHRDDVVCAEPHAVRNIKCKWRIGAPVHACRRPVHEHLGDLRSALELQEKTPAPVFHGGRKMPAVPRNVPE